MKTENENEKEPIQEWRKYIEPIEESTCEHCQGEMTYCESCQMYSSYCCEEYGTCACS